MGQLKILRWRDTKSFSSSPAGRFARSSSLIGPKVQIKPTVSKTTVLLAKSYQVCQYKIPKIELGLRFLAWCD